MSEVEWASDRLEECRIRISKLEAEKDRLAIESETRESELLDLRDAISPSSFSVQDSINRARATRTELAALRSENASLRIYGEEVGKVLLDEIDETSFNDISVVEAATILTSYMIKSNEDSFAVHELTAFEEEVSGETVVQRYDLLIQKAGAQTYQENLDACKQDNAALRSENQELAQIFEIQRSRMDEATELMRQSNACEPDVLPDLGSLLGWLVGRIIELEEEVDEFRSSEAYRRLERLIDEANEKLRWRKLEEEKPEDGQRCIVWSGYTGIELSTWNVTAGDWHSLGRQDWWRPLPEGPEE